MSDKVSVIMSTYNTPKKYLSESICSILKQTYSNIEFIIVCDGSEEEYQYILSKYKDERLKVLLNKQNKGLPFSLNRGISESTGKYIARMDSDDISLPNRIEEELRYLKKNRLDLCGASVFFFGEKRGRKHLPFSSCEDIRIWLLFVATLMHPTVLGKADVFKENRYNEEFVCAQDFELWSRLAETYTLGYYKKPLLKYRIHKKQATSEKGEIQRELAEIIVKNNASKISGKYDKKVFRCLWLLGGREKITRQNYEEYSQLIDYTLALNERYGKYNRKEMKKIFYNRFFELVLKYRIPVRDFNSMKKVAHFYNLKDLMIYGMGKMMSKFGNNARVQ